MPHYATLSDIPSLYDSKVTGYAVEGKDFQLGNLVIIYAAILGSSYIVMALSTPLFAIISEAINDSSGKGRKPKLYYHFWAAILLIVGGLWGYEIIYHFHLTNNTSYGIPFFLMVFMSLIGTAIAISSDKKIKAFSVPLSECCCCVYSKKCRNRWSCVMTIMGMYFTISLLTYLLYAVPTIVFVYYLYPTRTLIRVPFIIGAIFYTITLQSLVLYQFEILCYGYFTCRSKDSNRLLLEEVKTDAKKSYGGTQLLDVNSYSTVIEFESQDTAC